mmetsp:Transcript_5111/g.15143  ORF Transcript_5111/g.15143 Transcript_5111/m.15143 type:complete len:120 (+) Transcript_5111:422-781(+)
MSQNAFDAAHAESRAHEILRQPMALPENLSPAWLPARATPGAQRLVLSMLQEYCHVLYAHADVARKQRVGANRTVILADDVRNGGRATGLHPALMPPPGCEHGADGAPIAVTYTPSAHT